MYASGICIRMSGIVELTCEHGVGHPDEELTRAYNPKTKFNPIHGCDGCCSDLHPTPEQIAHLLNRRK